jgi:DNA topoisomerase-1
MTREQFPEHIKALKLPPAWTGVRVNPDPQADLQAIGIDAKGRPQYVYSERYSESQAAIKFERIKAMQRDFGKMQTDIESAKASADDKKKSLADCMSLVAKMGIRPGSTADTKAKRQAYGATTLEGRHVVKDNDGVHLVFTGKSGKDLNLPVTDPDLAAMLVKRAKAAGSNGHLFNVSEKDLLDFSHSLDGGKYKTKDFRTYLGTTLAQQHISAMTAPANEKEYRKAVMTVAKNVSAALGNTPTIALQSYISPAVFLPWREAAEHAAPGQTNKTHMQAMFSRIEQPDGRFTYQPLSDREPQGGFALSVYPERSFAKPVADLKYSDLAGYVKRNKDLLAKPDHFIGAWHDPESGMVFLDVSVVTDDEKKATTLALEHDQIAYFDLARGASVMVNRQATSGGAVHAN